MINYILQGFGFTGWRDFINSSFGHILSVNFIAVDVVISALVGLIHFLFGFNHLFLAAYVVLLLFEWITGVLASFKRGERHESRKFEFDPFHWLYWVVLLAIIWQLVVSLLENLGCLGFRFANVLLKIINKKFFKMFDLTEETENTNT